MTKKLLTKIVFSLLRVTQNVIDVKWLGLSKIDFCFFKIIIIIKLLQWLFSTKHVKIVKLHAMLLKKVI